MNHRAFSKILGLITIYLILPLKCLADILPPPLSDPFYIPLVFCVDFLVIVFLLIISFLILKRGSLIKSLKFLKYVFLVAAGGFLIDLIYIIPKELGIIGIMPISFILTVLGVGFYNYWLSKKLFNLSKKEAIFIGVIMAIFATPISPINFLPYLQSLSVRVGL